MGFEPTLSEQYGSTQHAPLTTQPLLHCEKMILNNSVYKREQKIFLTGKWISFWKIKVHQRFWYTMRRLNSELAPSLTHNCKSYRLTFGHFTGQAFLCINELSWVVVRQFIIR